MGWFELKAPGDLDKPEQGATLQHVWSAVRQMQQHIGGIPAQLATIALAQSRLDARVESLANDLAAIRRHQLGARVDDEDQDHEDGPR